ncbi:histidine phosphatase family protein [Thermoleophilia bacterium SCSIO 60948]|nr:histidine phosphatase family protein [Thermoleophilia bacterium SCSIO 60948]
MTRRLHLLRHAKSSWDDASLADHDRPLNERGVSACELVARDLEAAGVEPGLVICSTAVRTRQTLELIGPGLGGEPELRFERGVYEAAAGELLELIADLGGEETELLVVGHNPATATLAAALAGAGDADALERMRQKFPTAARASLSFEGAWDQLEPGSATLEAFVRPRDLAS